VVLDLTVAIEASGWADADDKTSHRGVVAATGCGGNYRGVVMTTGTWWLGNLFVRCGERLEISEPKTTFES
jgi:hypothetical protein